MWQNYAGEKQFVIDQAVFNTALSVDMYKQHPTIIGIRYPKTSSVVNEGSNADEKTGVRTSGWCTCWMVHAQCWWSESSMSRKIKNLLDNVCVAPLYVCTGLCIALTTGGDRG